MNKLKIKLDPQTAETGVPASVVDKLVSLGKAGTDMELVGTINVVGGLKKSKKDYMDLHYGSLNLDLSEYLIINAPKIYLDFEDPAVETIMMSVASSDGIGVTVEDAAALLNNLFPSFVNNTTVTSFNELKEFTNITLLSYLFKGCSNLAHIDLTNIRNLGDFTFQNTSLTGVLNLPNFVSFTGRHAFVDCSSLTEVNFGPYLNPEGLMTGMFLGCSNLVRVTGLNNVTKIYGEMFKGCLNLEYIDLDFSKITSTSTGVRTFQNCKKLFTNLDLSQTNFTEIGGECFYGCTSLLSITLPNILTTIGGNAFEYCSELTSIVIPSGVTSIGSCAFYYCTSLTSINIPNGVTSIGDQAFESCTSLTSIDIPDSVTIIGQNAFSGCTGLLSVTLSGNLTKIAELCFMNCSSLLNIDIDWSKIITIGGGAFKKTSSLAISNLSIPNLTSLGEDAFRESGIISISNLGSITELPQRCFQKTSSLVSVTLPNTVTKIWYCAFTDSSISTINIPSSVTSLYKECFYRCTNLNGTFDLSNVTLLESNAFTNCNNVTISNFPRATTYPVYCFLGIKNTSITIPKEVVTIGDGAFQTCANLETVSFEANSNLTTVGINAFASSPKLTSISYPEGVTTLKRDTVSDSRNLLSIELPSTVTTINGKLVYNNYSLQSITCKATTPPQASSELFSYINNTCVIYVPASSVSAYQSATGWSSVASRIQAIPAS